MPKPKEPVLLIAVTTLGKRARLQNLLDSIKAQNNKNFILGVCDQSDTRNLAELFDFTSLENHVYVIPTTSRGASLGRNLVVSQAPERVTHIFFANDTSILDLDFVDRISSLTATADINVLSYLEHGKPRYSFDQGSYALNRKNIWLCLEGATVISRQLMERVGGFDENIGAGSPTIYGSGEGTDLLFRAIPFRPTCLWSPQIHVHGVPENYGLTRREHQKKMFLYGVGYGSLLSKYEFGITKKVAAISAPVLRTLSLRMNVMSALYSSAGRFWGIIKFQGADGSNKSVDGAEC